MSLLEYQIDNNIQSVWSSLISEKMDHGYDPNLRVFPYFHQYGYLVILGYLRVKECPAGLEPLTGARNRRKATVKKKRRNLYSAQ